MLADVWSTGGVRDVYADFNELTLDITTNALFGVDMSSSQALNISGKYQTETGSSHCILTTMSSSGLDQVMHICSKRSCSCGACRDSLYRSAGVL